MKPNKSKKPILILSLVLIALLSLSFGVFALDAYAKGDVSGDGEITAEDARLALRGAVGLENFAPGSKEYNAADVDGTEGLSAADARLILRAAVGLETLTQPVGPENPTEPEPSTEPVQPTEPVYPETKVYVIDNWEVFPTVLGELFEKEKARFEEIGFEDYADEFFTCRVIVKATSAPDYSGYQPTIVIDGPDDYYLYQFLTREEAKRFQEEMQTRDNIVFAEPDKIVSIIDPEPSEEEMSISAASGFNSWGVSYIQADKYASYLKNNKYTSSIVVAVVDSGVDNTHAYFKGRLVSGYDFIDNDSTPYVRAGDNAHGTHVSGTIVDCTPGLNVKIMPVRIFKGRSTTNSLVTAGISYAVSHSANVINLSLGGGHSSMIEDAVKNAISKGITVCVSAGNEDANTSGYCPAHITSAGCICVSAIDSNGRIADFSNYGAAVDVTAPGVMIKSAIPGGGYGYMDGTSMAAPHISAVAAMYKLRYPSATPAQIEQYVRKYVKDLYSTGFDSFTGYGVPQLSKAIPAATKYTLTVKKGTGVASVSGGGSYAAGTKVTVKATVSSGYKWSKWTSSNTSLLAGSTAQTYTFTMPKGGVTLTASAVANPTKYTLTVKKGTGIASVSGGGSYAAGAKVTVKATLSGGYLWKKWTSSNTSLLAGSASQTYTFTMPKGNVTLTASAAIPATKAEIISYYVTAYNKIATEAKTVKRTQSSYTNYRNIVEVGNNKTIGNLVKNLMDGLLVEDNTEFNGTAKDLPPKGITKLSISPSQIGSAAIKDNGATYTVVLKSTGSVSNYEYNAQPGKGSAGVIGPLVDNNDIRNAAPNFTFTGLNTKYATASVTATINKSTGRITQLVFDTPGVVYCSSVRYSIFTIDNPQVGVEIKQIWKLAY